jgi:endo-1,4-beta-xylanase
MTNKKIIASFILSGTLAISAFGQGNTQKTLKQAYAGKFLIGCADDLRANSEAYQANIRANYDIVTPENCMKPERIHPAEDRYTFETADALVDWSQKNGLKVWGHTLGWHSQTPAWFFQDKNAQAPSVPDTARPRNPNAITGPLASKEVVLERLKNHIMTVVGRYKGRIKGWDVFNESIADGGDGTTENLRTNSWYRAVGPEVISLAFKWAHEADPDAQLYYNDYNIEQGAVENKGKHASSLLLLKRLLKEGVPITGVGIQGHWHLNTNLADVEKAIENYAALGLRVSITELDVTATGANSGAFGVNQGDRTIPAENFEKQAEVYKKLFEIFMRHQDVIDRVTFWGLSDTLLFDGDLNPKPAYKAVIEASEKK